jgi:hypothetical protein
MNPLSEFVLIAAAIHNSMLVVGMSIMAVLMVMVLATFAVGRTQVER